MEYFPSLSVVAVRLISIRRTVACGTGLPPASVTRPESVRASDPERAAAAGRHRPLAVATHVRIVATRTKCVVVICSPLASRRLQCPPAPGGECRLREEWLRGPARRVCDASCRQESAGGARGGGRSRSVARWKGAGAAGRATRLSATSRRNRMGPPVRVGAGRKWHSAQSGGWLRAELAVRPGGGARQRQLQGGSEEPGGSHGGRASRQERHREGSVIQGCPPTRGRRPRYPRPGCAAPQLPSAG